MLFTISYGCFANSLEPISDINNEIDKLELTVDLLTKSLQEVDPSLVNAKPEDFFLTEEYPADYFYGLNKIIVKKKIIYYLS